MYINKVLKKKRKLYYKSRKKNCLKNILLRLIPNIPQKNKNMTILKGIILKGTNSKINNNNLNL